MLTSYQYGFVAVASESAHGGATTAWTSPDGRTWTMRPDWDLPINVTGIVGMGSGLVAVANGTGVAPSPSASPTPKPSPTKAGTAGTASWWYSTSGLVWRQTSLTTIGTDYAVVNGRILAFSIPATAGAGWTAFSSADGRTWQSLGATTATFPGAPYCRIASSGSRVAIVGWQGTAQLKDYFGTFAGN